MHAQEPTYVCSPIKPGGPGFAQIQMVVPIAATSLETAQGLHSAGLPERAAQLLAEAYDACSRWDAWLPPR